VYFNHVDFYHPTDKIPQSEPIKSLTPTNKKAIFPLKPDQNHPPQYNHKNARERIPGGS